MNIEFSNQIMKYKGMKIIYGCGLRIDGTWKNNANIVFQYQELHFSDFTNYSIFNSNFYLVNNKYLALARAE